LRTPARETANGRMRATCKARVLGTNAETIGRSGIAKIDVIDADRVRRRRPTKSPADDGAAGTTFIFHPAY
jgi:hypothetical protein